MAAGEEANTWLKVGETPLGDVRMPLSIVNGKKEGPVLCITAGIHGFEYPGIATTGQLIRSIDPKDLRGTLLLVPVVNVLSYDRATPFVCPVDGLNLNRIFPVSQVTTVGTQMAHTLFEEVIPKAEYHIDCHSGDRTECLLPHVILTLVGSPRVDAVSEAMARVYGLGHIAPTGEGSKLPRGSGTLNDEVAKRGIPSIVSEIGGDGGLTRSEIDLNLKGFMNIMKFLGMLDGEPDVPARQYAAETKFFVRVKRGGLLVPLIEMGTTVKSGDPVAEVRDVFGGVLETVRAPQDGYLRFMMANRAVNSGEVIMNGWSLRALEPMKVKHISELRW